MCYGWEPDDIIQIITDLKRNNELNSLKIIDEALEKMAIGLGEKYRIKDFPEINLSNYILRWYNSEDENIMLIKNEPNEVIMKTKRCRIYEIFKLLENMDIGFQYKCRQDYFLIKGYEKTFELEIEKCLMKGDEYCLHHFRKIEGEK
jgi:hypothetical protein